MPTIKRKRATVDDYIAILTEHDRKQAQRATRDAAISQLAKRAAQGYTLMDHVETVVVIIILAIVGIMKTGGL
ncbi:hypothetical protein [Methylomonas sp. ZR1]|uniref:hypothetical protein n=1 Tax=Methylomonas sp. ZR1 TaxID=1797072 RepID=UPI0014931C2F|nr:hypothetical protein [Methylomonas sp. ZR1]NOV29201.1 hypothetical protein [Methylomonas sp. ZR1]